MKVKESPNASAVEEPALHMVPKKPGSDLEAFPPGAMIHGKVVSRTRREVKAKSGKPSFNITLSVLAKQGLFMVTRWASQPFPPDLPVIGQEIQIPVRLSAYMQSGVPKVRIVWETDEETAAL